MMLRIDIVYVEQQEFCQFLMQWLCDEMTLIVFDRKLMSDSIYDLSVEQTPEKADSILQLIYAKHVLYASWGAYSKHYETWKACAALSFAQWKLKIKVPDVELHEVFSI